MTRVSASTTRFTVPEFERMVEADLFGTDRVELINGRVYVMAPQADPHQFAVGKVNRALARVVPENEMLLVPGTLRLNTFTIVDPDLVWFAVPYGTAEHNRPRPLLLVEVSHTTYKRDSGIKLREYAKYGIEDYWIVNVKAKRIETYRRPEPGETLSKCRFADVSFHGPDDRVALLNRPTVSFAVSDLLP